MIVTVFYTSFPKNARGKGTIWNARAGEMILNALRVALRIDSGIMILICISAKPAELVGAKPLHLLTADRSAA